MAAAHEERKKYIAAGDKMYSFGQHLTDDLHFSDHMKHQVPVQIYYDNAHKDVGFVETYTPMFIKVNNTFYNRTHYTFVSRPGY